MQPVKDGNLTTVTILLRTYCITAWIQSLRMFSRSQDTLLFMLSYE